MADLSTRYLGLPLGHPVVASAGPLSRDLDGIRRLEDAGAAAIVLFSLFEEQIRSENAALEHLTSTVAHTSAEAEGYFPTAGSFEVGPEAYLNLVRRARQAVGVPVIGSLNGATSEGWVDYACLLHEAGASAIELNLFHIPADLRVTGREVEQQYEDVVNAVSGAVPIPVAVKLSPFFSATGEMAQRFVRAGARGLVLFNRFYQPDFDLATLDVTPTLDLSSPREIRLPLLWSGDPLRADRRVARCNHRRAHASRGREVSAGGRGRDDDDLVSARTWPRPPADAGAGPRRVAGAEGIRLGDRHQRIDEPATRRRTDGVRTGELREDPDRLEGLARSLGVDPINRESGTTGSHQGSCLS